MNIHLIPNEKFTNKFVELIEKKYDANSNHIYVYNYGLDFDIMKSKNVTLIKSFAEVDLSVLKKSDKVFVHSFADFRLLRFLYKNIRRFTKYQLVLIAWGGDIYCKRDIIKEKKPNFTLRFYECLKKKVVENTDIFMTFACADIEIIRKYYNGKGKQFDCLYPSNVDVELLDYLYKNRNDDGSSRKPVRILLGNSATETNRHILALNAMSRFLDENIEIICPLSYGSVEYRDAVIKYGKKMYGKKFIPIINYMSPEKYARLLNSVDLAVFYHNRQQGTGNIEILSYLGKKLYICSDTTTWLHYVKRDKCRFFDAKKINTLSFNDFISMKEEYRSINRKYFKKIWNIEYVKTLWDKVMNYNG